MESVWTLQPRTREPWGARGWQGRAASRPPDKLLGGGVATGTWWCLPSTRALVAAEGTRGAGQPHGVGHSLCWSLSDCNPATQETHGSGGQQTKASPRGHCVTPDAVPTGAAWSPLSWCADGADEVLSCQCPWPRVLSDRECILRRQQSCWCVGSASASSSSTNSISTSRAPTRGATQRAGGS